MFESCTWCLGHTIGAWVKHLVFDSVSRTLGVWVKHVVFGSDTWWLGQTFGVLHRHLAGPPIQAGIITPSFSCKHFGFSVPKSIY